MTSGAERRDLTAVDKRERRRRAREIRRQLHPWTRRRVMAWSLFVIAFVIAVQHIFAHLGYTTIHMGMGKQDLLVGWPMASILALIGLMIIDPPADSKRKRRS